MKRLHFFPINLSGDEKMAIGYVIIQVTHAIFKQQKTAQAYCRPG
ncbi:MAG: hypothetical protein WBB19_18720 [Desulforhopalus sp.]